jgi:ribonucleoside-diphosphate reductase alpha chain
MDCDTTGVEPDFALVKFKKLAGGGYFKIANNSLRPALESLGYDEEPIREIMRYVLGTLSLDVAMPGEAGRTTGCATCFARSGLNEDDLNRSRNSCPAFSSCDSPSRAWSLPADARPAR